MTSIFCHVATREEAAHPEAATLANIVHSWCPGWVTLLGAWGEAKTNCHCDCHPVQLPLGVGVIPKLRHPAQAIVLN